METELDSALSMHQAPQLHQKLTSEIQQARRRTSKNMKYLDWTKQAVSLYYALISIFLMFNIFIYIIILIN